MRHSEKHVFLGQKRCFYALHADLQKDDRQGVTRKQKKRSENMFRQTETYFFFELFSLSVSNNFQPHSSSRHFTFTRSREEAFPALFCLERSFIKSKQSARSKKIG